MTFWIISAALALIAGALVARPLLRAAPDAMGSERSENDIGIYRDQLAEVDRDLARGVLNPEEAERTRTEISRRILAADRAAVASARVRPATAIGGALLVLVVAGTAALYADLGAPGYPDIPLADRLAAAEELRTTRPSQEEMEAEIAALPRTPVQVDDATKDVIERLRAVVAQRPDELQGWQYLVGVERDLQNYPAAARAQNEVIRLKGDAATVGDLNDLLDLMVVAAGGRVSPEAEELIAHLLNSDPTNTAARFYLGTLYAQTDRPDIAFRLWRAVIEQGAQDDPYVQQARGVIEEAAFRAGEDYTLPPERGPSAADVANAAEMSDEDRNAMIRGMVDQLSERLATEGGTPAEWARLINALGVLGDTDRARAIWTEAQTVFAAAPDAIAAIREAAVSAGVAE